MKQEEGKTDWSAYALQSRLCAELRRYRSGKFALPIQQSRTSNASSTRRMRNLRVQHVLADLGCLARMYFSILYMYNILYMKFLPRGIGPPDDAIGVFALSYNGSHFSILQRFSFLHHTSVSCPCKRLLVNLAPPVSNVIIDNLGSLLDREITTNGLHEITLRIYTKFSQSILLKPLSNHREETHPSNKSKYYDPPDNPVQASHPAASKSIPCTAYTHS